MQITSRPQPTLSAGRVIGISYTAMWGRMEPGGSPSLQNCAGGGDPGAGGFDSHAPSPPPSFWAQSKSRSFSARLS